MFLFCILLGLFSFVNPHFYHEGSDIAFQVELTCVLTIHSIQANERDTTSPSYRPEFIHCSTVTVINEVVTTTGKRWMDRNLGASRVAHSIDDSLAFGYLFQWGRFADGHQCRKSEVLHIQATTASSLGANVWQGKFITSTISPYDWLIKPDSSLWQGLTGENNPCPLGYRVPTCAEWQAEWKTWKPEKHRAFLSVLRLPQGGFRRSTSGDFLLVGEYGLYWSSTLNNNKSCGLYFYQADAGTNAYPRGRGFSIRCIRE